MKPFGPFLASLVFVVAFVLTPVSSAFAQAFEPYWVQTTSATELWSGASGEPTSVSFGPIRAWSYLRVLEPQKGSRLYVENPITKGTAWVDATKVGPSGNPPESYLATGMIVKRSVDSPARAVGSARVRSTPEVTDSNLVGNLSHNEGVNVAEEVVYLYEAKDIRHADQKRHET